MTRDELLAVAKPILFNTEMVRAILDGFKTVTRRCVKPKSKYAYGFCVTRRVSDGAFMGVYDYDEDENSFDNPQTQPAYKGDILYVRETWFYECHMEDKTAGEPDLPSGGYLSRFVYKASSPNYPVDIGVGANGWRPSIHMPKEAARIFLRVTDVRVERLQDINTGGIRNEGLTSMAVHAGDMEIAQAEFALLWDTTVKESELEDYGWAANPWVWVIEFERLEVSEND